MRLLVVGTGGVGGYYGARLADAGNDVRFIARGANLEALRRNGLELRSDFGDLRLPSVEAGETADGRSDAVLVCVKTYDSDSAAKAMADAVGEGTTICSLQNGVDNEVFFTERFPRATVIAGTTRIVAWLEEPGVIEQRGPDVTVTLAAFDAADTGAAQGLHDALAAAKVPVHLSPDANTILWLKLAGIASVGTLTAYGRCTISQVLADPDLAKLMSDVCGEVDAVARAKGVSLPEGMCETILGYARAMPEEFNSSMARDLEAGRPLEIESITGAVVAAGERAGIPTPANRRILDDLLPLHRTAMAARGS
jgi:2-dehydropantoate 2-reductase